MNRPTWEVWLKFTSEDRETLSELEKEGLFWEPENRHSVSISPESNSKSVIPSDTSQMGV